MLTVAINYYLIVGDNTITSVSKGRVISFVEPILFGQLLYHEKTIFGNILPEWSRRNWNFP